MKSNLTNEQLIDKVKAWVKKLCETGGSAWTLKVPVDLDNDPDVLIIELCNRFASQPPAQGEGKLECITFNELVEHGKLNCGLNIVNGMPWSFNYKGHPITHENDKCYLIPVNGVGYEKFTPNDILITDNSGQLHVLSFPVSNQPPAPSGMGEAVNGDELWDEYSEYIDDDLDSLQMVAGRSVIKKESFEKMIAKLTASTPPVKEQWVCECENKTNGFTLVAGYSYCNTCGKRC